MARKQRFPPEADTRPDLRRPATPVPPPVVRQSGPAPKDYRERSELATLPPPTRKQGRGGSARPKRGRVSDVREVDGAPGGATIDEVTADLSKDPRRERDDE